MGFVKGELIFYNGVRLLWEEIPQNFNIGKNGEFEINVENDSEHTGMVIDYNLLLIFTIYRILPGISVPFFCMNFQIKHVKKVCMLIKL